MTSHLLVNEIAILVFAVLLVVAAVGDLRRLTIPNRIPLGIIVLYPAYVLSANGAVDWTGAAMLSSGALVVGLLLFSLRYAGGGDVKLFAAASLWAGPALFQNFLLVTSIVGGAMAIGMLVHRRYFSTAHPPWPPCRTETPCRQRTTAAPQPPLPARRRAGSCPTALRSPPVACRSSSIYCWSEAEP